MEDFKKYKDFLMSETKNNDDLFRFIMNDIHINIDLIIKVLKDEFDMKCWYLYNSENSVSFEYSHSSNESYENIMKIKKFFFDKLPYFRDIICYDDDKRLVLKFVEVGSPVKFKFICK